MNSNLAAGRKRRYIEIFLQNPATKDFASFKRFTIYAIYTLEISMQTWCAELIKWKNGKMTQWIRLRQRRITSCFKTNKFLLFSRQIGLVLRSFTIIRLVYWFVMSESYCDSFALKILANNSRKCQMSFVSPKFTIFTSNYILNLSFLHFETK